MTTLDLRVAGIEGEAPLRVAVPRLLLAGYTGRDRRAVLEHVRELEELGVAPPERIPAVFVVDPGLVRVIDRIYAASTETSGEAEVVLIFAGDEWFVGVGSDHTDRAHEAIDVDASKAMCPKPIARTVWRYRDVAPHWDALELRAWTVANGQRRLYQEGTLAAFLPVAALLDELHDVGFDEDGCGVVFGGTLPTIGGLTCGDRFEIELRDPIMGRSLAAGYDVSAPAAALPLEADELRDVEPPWTLRTAEP
jgi:hypothetical protein